MTSPVARNDYPPTAPASVTVSHLAPPCRAPQETVVLELLTQCLKVDSFAHCLEFVVDRLACQLGCERISLGWRSGGWRRRVGLRLTAVSHMRRFDARSAVAHALVAAMEEVCVGDVPILITARDTPPPQFPAHAELLRNGPPRTLYTLPLLDKGVPVGALTLEYIANPPADTGVFDRLPELLMPLTAVLVLREHEHHGGVLRRLQALSRRLTGAREWRLKAIVAMTVLAIGVALVPGQYRITAPAELAGRMQRAIVAPQDGYIATATVRPGDRVRAGDVVATLDARELDLQRANVQAERDRYRKTYRSALAERDWAQSRIAGAQLAQAQAQFDLVETQLARTRLQAPLDGMVVAGDPQQSLGAPVQRGQILLEIAPLDGYRVVLKVDERRIAGVTAGQIGTVILSAAPDTPLPVRIESVTPVAEVGEGYNRFRVEAQLLETPDWVRPGLSGVAKITVAERSFGWIWTHDLVEWLRLTHWKLLP